MNNLLKFRQNKENMFFFISADAFSPGSFLRFQAFLKYRTVYVNRRNIKNYRLQQYCTAEGLQSGD